MKYIMGSAFSCPEFTSSRSKSTNEVRLRDRFSSRPEFAPLYAYAPMSRFRDQFSGCPEFCSIISSRINEVEFETGFWAIMNLLHFKLMRQ